MKSLPFFSRKIVRIVTRWSQKSEVISDSFVHLCRGTYNNKKEKTKSDVKELAFQQKRERKKKEK